jgi:hypothetical protein
MIPTSGRKIGRPLISLRKLVPRAPPLRSQRWQDEQAGYSTIEDNRYSLRLDPLRPQPTNDTLGGTTSDNFRILQICTVNGGGKVGVALEGVLRARQNTYFNAMLRGCI